MAAHGRDARPGPRRFAQNAASSLGQREPLADELHDRGGDTQIPLKEGLQTRRVTRGAGQVPGVVQFRHVRDRITIPQGSLADADEAGHVPAEGVVPAVETHRLLVHCPGAVEEADHAVVEHVKGSDFLTDKGSTNGTFVNGKKITKRTRIIGKEEIMVGKFTMLAGSVGILDVEKKGQTAGGDDDKYTMFVGAQPPAEPKEKKKKGLLKKIFK